MARKIKKRKSMEIAAFKDKSRFLVVLTFGHSYLNILS
jgi:non-ribosomal peptide synthetase component E (peptide arylation enzyme)